MKKVLLIVIVAIAALFLIGLFVPKSPKAEEATTAPEATEVATPPAQGSRYLPGIDSGELTAALEKRGFVVTHNYSAEAGHTWMAKGGDPGLSYAITYASDVVGKVDGLSGTVMVTDFTAKTIDAGRPFINSLVTMPFADDSVRAMVADKYASAYSTIGDTRMDTISGTIISFGAPNGSVRSVDIRPAP